MTHRQQQVLLYKFFEHSSVEQSQWRLVFNLLDSEASTAPKFDEVRHAALCTEVLCKANVRIF